LIEKSRTGNVLNFALNMFEATVALGETEFQHYLRPTARDEYECKENTALVIGDPRIFVPPLECKINHYREVLRC
uniref:Cytochrome P450 n=1 Tax=Heligmosomoides polygyrus TaxID=6339 RepID=A0A183GKV3_HELPZ